MRDWSLIFTIAFRSDNVQQIINKIYGARDEKSFTKENMEEITVKICAQIMTELEKTGRV